MFVRVYKHLGDKEPIEQPAALVVVEDSSGNPVAVATELGTHMVAAATAGDKDFNQMLRGLGLNKVVVTKRINPDQTQ